MPRETALTRTKRLLELERKDHRHSIEWGQHLAQQRNKAEDRCAFLYETAIEFAVEHAQTRLRGTNHHVGAAANTPRFGTVTPNGAPF